jgi:hypothetical protein
LSSIGAIRNLNLAIVLPLRPAGRGRGQRKEIRPQHTHHSRRNFSIWAASATPPPPLFSYLLTQHLGHETTTLRLGENL